MKSLSHNGIIIPKYEAAGLSIIILRGLSGAKSRQGQKIKLTPLQEEMAVALMRQAHLDCFKDPVFIRNFMRDFSRELGDKTIRFDDIDFSPVRKFVENAKAAREGLTKEQRKALREQRKKVSQANKNKYGYATVDGEKIEIAAFRAEPAGIFKGRGDHPLRGRWKPAVRKQDIVLNLSPKSPMPEGFVQREWDPNGRWIAKWDNNRKYVWLSPNSHIRQKDEVEKFEKAVELSNNINGVRLHIMMNMRGQDVKRRKIATCCFLIDNLGIRVGDEKSEDEADTVGATTLRPEHLRILGNTVRFKFLGKDGVLFDKTVEMPKPVLLNLTEFIKDGKTIFNGISSVNVNAFLKEAMPGLTGKVFRTYLGTKAAKEFIENAKVHKDESTRNKKLVFKGSAFQAAKILNHKRKVPATFEQSIKNKEERILKLLAKATPASLKRADELKAEVDKAIEQKEFNINTSLRSYIDPRVYQKWAKKTDTDLNKMYPAGLRKKFSWALPADEKTVLPKPSEKGKV